MKRLVYGLAAMALLLLTAAGRAGAEYIVTDLGTLGGTSSYAYGINASGQVVGQAEIPGWGFHAFLYSDGKMTDLGTFDGRSSSARAINDAGQVVGYSGNRGFVYHNGTMTDLGIHEGHPYGINASGQIVGEGVITKQGGWGAFLYNNGKVTDLGTLGGNGAIPTGINTSGQVTGYSWKSPAGFGPRRAFLYSDGKMTELPAVIGWAINASGQVVGASGNGRAFLYSGGKVTELGTLDGIYSSAYGINDHGQVVGSLSKGFPDSRAFLYSDGKMVDLNSLLPTNSGWVLEQATGINNKAQIVGWGKVPSGRTHAFLLTPVEAPEPGSLTLLGLGALGLAGYAWRRRRAARTA
jgi:probable HAF family extracellular repeat protein